MPLAPSRPPKRSLDKLKTAMASLALLKDQHRRWMKLHPPTASHLRGSYAHPLYSIRVPDLLRGHAFGRSLSRVAWMYLLCDAKETLAAAEVSIVHGAHGSVRTTEGPFVGKLKRAIEKVARDRRLRGRVELRSIRVESLHLFVLWLKMKDGGDLFMPVSGLKDSLKAGRRYTEAEIVAALLPEAQRVREAHLRMLRQQPRVERA
ncbi:MAG TPA: hypothetical protein VFF39_15380 [Verrucomicrobiae bacterium]|nr:hypothetical protein [Verrucomicrobiae bacterium]